LCQRVADLQSANAELKTENTQLGRGMAELESENSELGKSITELRSENAELKRGVSALEARMERVERNNPDKPSTGIGDKELGLAATSVTSNASICASLSLGTSAST
jgi:chromosome segregation ATPase